MFAYFKIRYLAENEFDVEQQMEFIRNYIEGICKFGENGFKYKNCVEHRPRGYNEKNEPIVLVKYQVRKNINISHIEDILQKNEVLDELLFFIAL